MLGVGLHLPACVGEEEPPSDPVKQSDAIVLFQFPYGHTDGGLGDVQLFRRRGSGPLPAHG